MDQSSRDAKAVRRLVLLLETCEDLSPSAENGGESHEFGIKDIELRSRETARSANKNLLGLIKMSFTFCSLVIPGNAGPSQSQEHREIRSAMRLVGTR